MISEYPELLILKFEITSILAEFVVNDTKLSYQQP